MHARLAAAAGSRARQVWLPLLVVACLTMSPGAASAEPLLTELAWTHPQPERLRGFSVLFAQNSAERANPKSIDVGLPGRSDRFAWSIVVPERSTVWVAVVAVSASGERSAPSEWRRYDWRPGQGPLGRPARPYLVSDAPR